jgi:hypothetical protein
MHRVSNWLWILAALLAVGGCGGNQQASYVPPSGAAHEALTMALDAWKNGQPGDPAGKLASGATVRGIDMDWAAGQKLASYEIIKELPAGAEAGPRKIVAKLCYVGRPQPVEATYLVVGIDPIQVFRDKDYEKYFGAP